MRFSLAAVVAALAAGAAASPTLGRRSCDIVGCVTALAPDVETCATAAISEGTDILGDFNCLTDAYSLVTDFPASCAGCFSLSEIESIF